MATLLTRRSFLDSSMRLALTAAASATLGVPPALRRALAAGTIPTSSKKVFFIFLRGGNDGLNTVIPWGDDAYNKTNRPTLYIPAPDAATSLKGLAPSNPDLTRVIDLGNGFAGIHPGFKEAIPVYNAGQLAVIHRVGYPRQSRSHFDSQKYWENGVPRDNLLGSGLFYRAIMDTGLAEGKAFPAVSVQSKNPLLLRGPLALTNLSDPKRYDALGVSNNATDKQKLLDYLAAGQSIDYPAKDSRDLLFTTGRSLRESIDVLKSVGVDKNDLFDADGTTHLFPIDGASNQKKYPAGWYSYFNKVKTAAQILAKTDAVIAGTEIGGFDTHNNQGAATGGHANLMQQIAWTLYAVRQYFNSVNPDLWDNTVIVTLSEFGRTSKENGNQGTDHAEAGPMLVAGGKVKGGVYQCDGASWKTGPQGVVFGASSRYLSRSVDYRSVFGEIVRDHMGATASQLEDVIPGYGNPREFLKSGGTSLDGTKIVGELGLV